MLKKKKQKQLDKIKQDNPLAYSVGETNNSFQKPENVENLACDSTLPHVKDNFCVNKGAEKLVEIIEKVLDGKNL